MELNFSKKDGSDAPKKDGTPTPPKIILQPSPDHPPPRSTSPTLLPRNKFLDIEDAHAVSRPLFHPTVSTDSVPIYRGSYAHTSHTSLKSIAEAMNLTNYSSPDHPNPNSPPSHTPRAGHTPALSIDSPPGNFSGTPRSAAFVEPKISYLQMKLQKLFGNQITEDRETYGIEELRNGFFDAIFVPPLLVTADHEKDGCENEIGVPVVSIQAGLFNKFKRYLGILTNSLLADTADAFHNINSRKGVKLLKVFVAYFIAYVFCLVHPIGNWFGRYNFFIPFASLIHHPGRTFGSQLEITAWSIFGMAIGLGWGSLALYIVSSTPRAKELYGLIHAISLVLALSIAGWLKAAFVRLHHFIASFVLTVFFLEVVNVGDSNGGIVDWDKAWQVGIPYLFGILIPLIINVVIFPDFGHHDVMAVIKCSLKECVGATSSFFSNDDKTAITTSLTKISLDFSESVREFSNEISFSTIDRKQLIEIRNKVQVGIARIRAVPSPSSLYTSGDEANANLDAANIIRSSLSKSSKELINTIIKTLQISIDYIIYLDNGTVTIKNYNQNYSQILHQQLMKTELAIAKLSHSYATTLRTDSYTLTNSPDDELFEILLHIYYLSEAGKAVLTIGRQFYEMSLKRRMWKLSLPHYPLRRAITRNTTQIIHDLGGKTAMDYYWAKRDVDEIFDEIYSIDTSRVDTAVNSAPPLRMKGVSHTVRYKIWTILHRLQGEETRFAIKATIAIVFISIPAWLEASSGWYNNYDIWLSGIIVFMIIHVRVGGNIHDFLIRTSLCLAGSIWAGIAVRARYNNPYVIGVFCAIFMLPCLYRFICSHHPRSGFIGCMSFTLISLSIYDKGIVRHDQLFNEIWTRVVACEVGVLVSFLVNWILWPFVARHQVRKSMSILLSHIGKTYHLISDRYLYRDKEDELTPLALQLSEICENRVHKSIFTVAELLESVDHEPSLRGTFDKSPYLSMLQSCEAILQDLIAARINSSHFNIHDFDPKGSERLMSFRRDSVASILFVLYILSGAFRSKDPIPRYLPSSPMARKVLFDCMAQLQVQQEQQIEYFNNYSLMDKGQSSSIANNKPSTSTVPTLTSHSHQHDEKRMWALVHETAFSKSFTRNAEEIEKLIFFSKQILGEQG